MRNRYGKKYSSTWVKIHNTAAQRANTEDIPRINNKPKYKEAAARGHFLDDNHPITKQYMNEHQDAFLKQVHKAANELGTNPSGTRKYAIAVHPHDKNTWAVHVVDVKHGVDGIDNLKPDASPSSEGSVKIKKDSKGRIVKIHPPNEMTQGDLAVGEILSHHGVLGMKWGQRRSREELASVSVKTRSGPQHKTIIKTKGGRGIAAHPDAIAAKVATQKLKKSGVHTLSNDELQKLATRTNLENQVKRSGVGQSTFEKGLNHTSTNFMQSSQGKTAVEEAAKVATSETGKKLVKHLFKGAAVAAAVSR